MTRNRPSDAVDIRHGDALDTLRGLPDVSADAVITDPPYGLSQEPDMIEVLRHWLAGDDYTHRGSGFMGRTWDSFVPGPAVWREVYRVLKPGGHLLCFAGTRTADLMGTAIRIAGFEVRDRIRVETTGTVLPAELAWEYGCLTADAEILTEHGWRPGIEVEVGEQVAQWDHATGGITLAPVEQVFRAPWDGPMRILRSADTDQVLTPNHRVYHQPRQRRMVAAERTSWYEDTWQVAEAGALSTWNPLRLPIAGEHDGPGIGGVDYAALLGWVWTEGGFDLSGSGVRVYQSSVNQPKVDEIASLLDRLGPHKRYDYDRTYTRRNGQPHTYTASTWYFSGNLASRVRADLPGKRPTYDLLWRMTGSEKRAFLRAAMLGDGTGHGTRCEQFFQKHEDDLIWLQTLLALIGRSGKVGMRPNRPGGSLYLRGTATTQLQGKHLRAVQTEHYTGEVWCVSVPTGAFVARRNGKVFITGNSGFPKSLDVGKAIDKAAGVEREVVGPPPYTRGRATQSYSVTRRVSYDYDPSPVTAPATVDAARWQGWGTALKPAYEPIIVARKPLAGTVAANVLTYGTGALNIDACRVEHGEPAGKPSLGLHGKRAGIMGATVERYRETTAASAAGRWPANVVLTHPQADDGGDACATGCVPGCPVADLDTQSGTTTSTPNPGTGRNLDTQGMGWGFRSMPGGFSDEGGASRFFPTFRYQAKADGSERPSYIGPVCHSNPDCSQITDEMHPSAWPEWARDPMGVCPECGIPCGPIMHPTVKPLDLARWLIRLVVAKGGTFIDPYVGSGTFAEAAILEGVNAIVVDKVGAHIPMIEQRVRKYDNPHAMALVRRGEKVATRAKARNVTPDDEDDLFAGWAS